MNELTLRHRTITLAASCAAIFCVALAGCSGSSKPDSEAGAYAASGGIPEVPDGLPPDPSSGPAASGKVPTSAPAAQQDPAAAVAAAAGSQDQTKPSIELRPLKPNLPPDKLVEFLAAADRDMELIYSGRAGITEPQEARDTLLHFVKMKLEASRQLWSHADASAAHRSEGARGKLQALSHLASLGDLKSAQELEKLATSNLESDDTRLAADSRLVLIGFAIESLQNGDKAAPDRIVNLIKQIADLKSQADVPALMTMGQARQSLVAYGHEAQARQVRDMIIELFADSPNPEIAKMAAQMAGSVQFDNINNLLGNVLRGETVAANDWRTAVGALIDESADLQTVRYLAGSALEFESLGQQELAGVTYDVLSKRFTEPGSATALEVQMAIEARKARQDIIGWDYNLKLPTTDGSSLAMEDFRGKVVLMPFWAMSSPESLQLLPRLKSIRDTYADQVAIVGMNLDGEAAPLDQFLQQSEFDFPSFRAQTPGSSSETPVAVQFGVVSMPFAAILDPQGRVAAITLTGHDLEKTVADLVRR